MWSILPVTYSFPFMFDDRLGLFQFSERSFYNIKFRYLYPDIDKEEMLRHFDTEERQRSSSPTGYIQSEIVMVAKTGCDVSLFTQGGLFQMHLVLMHYNLALQKGSSFMSHWRKPIFCVYAKQIRLVSRRGYAQIELYGNVRAYLSLLYLFFMKFCWYI